MYRKGLTPRISEVNGAGHIGHNVIPVWLEEGFVEILKLFHPDLRGRVGESMLVMANVNIDFIREIFLDEDVEIRTEVAKIGRASLSLVQDVYQCGKLCARGKPTFVYLDAKTRKSIPIPPSIRRALTDHLRTP
jgi:acyl-CoA thioester hydrolase